MEVHSVGGLVFLSLFTDFLCQPVLVGFLLGPIASGLFFGIFCLSTGCFGGGVLMDPGGVPPLPLPPELEAFKKLIGFGRKRNGGGYQNFVKKVDIPSVELPTERTCRLALNLDNRGLIGQFSGLWPSPKATDGWV